MIHPISHKNEKDRLASLHSFSILDSKPEKDFDNITALAADICNVPVSLVSFVDKDRQWFMSNHGTETKETPRQVSFCAHAILQDDIFIVSDARKDDRFKDNPSVTGKSNIVFYAGVPLIDKEGLPIGSLCVIDHKPRTLEKRQINALKTLATQVMNLLYLRKNEQEINSLNMQLIAKNQDLEKFAMVLAHDIKSPLNNIKGALHLLADDINEKVDKK
ncbi:MAG: GAF domain-containing protein, partial [Salibacteraceae bacterium]